MIPIVRALVNCTLNGDHATAQFLPIFAHAGTAVVEATRMSCPEMRASSRYPVLDTFVCSTLGRDDISSGGRS